MKMKISRVSSKWRFFVKAKKKWQEVIEKKRKDRKFVEKRNEYLKWWEICEIKRIQGKSMKKEMTASLSEKKFDWKLKSEVDRYEIVLSFIECQWTNQHLENGTKEIK